MDVCFKDLYSLFPGVANSEFFADFNDNEAAGKAVHPQLR
jgi:hypothetical protein